MLVFNFCFLLIILSTLVLTVWPSSEDNKFIVEETLATLIRKDRNGEDAPNDLGEAFPWKCTDDGLGDRNCNIQQPKNYPEETENSSDSYIDGLFMYGAINIAGAIVLVVFTALYLLVLIILAICKCMDCCQRKNAKTWFNYNTRLIVATTLVSLFLTIMIIIIILGHVLGGENLYNGITEASDAPAGAAAIAKDEVEPISNAYIGLVSSVAVPAIVALNSSLTVAINFKSVVVSLNSVNVSFNELPNLDNLANIINEVEGKTNNVSAIINNIQRELDVVDTLVNTDLVADIDELEADLLEVKYFQRNITIAISDTTTLVVSLSDTTDELLGENNDAGTVGRVESDLNTLSRNDAAGEGYPSTARFNAAATGSSASMTRLRADAYDGANSAEFSELNSRLGSLYSAIVVLPNYTATAVELISINDTINALIVPDGTIDQTVDSIAAIQDLIDNKFPNTTAFLSNVNDLLDLTERLDLAPLARNVSLLSTILLTLPDDLNDLLDIVEEVLDALPGLIDPLYDLLVVQTASFNATIYRLPKDLDTLRIFNDANDTITSGINDGREIIQEIRDAIQSINDVNATEYISQINDVEASIDDAVFTFDITEITDLVNSFDNSIDIDFSTINGHLADLRTALIAVKIDDNLINSLNDVQQNRIVLEERLERAIAPSGAEDSGGNPVGQIGDYLLLIQGNCANDATIYCSIDSDCSGVGGVCQNQGRYRCSENGNALAPFTTCNVDSDCSALGGSSFCLADDNRAAALQGILIAYGNENSNESKFPDTSITNDFDEVRTYGNFNFTAEIVRLNNAQRDVNSINTTVYEVQLDDISSQITAFDIAEINSAIADAKDVLDDVNYDTFDSTIDDLKKIVRDVQNGINDGITIVEGIEQFLFNSSFLAKHLNDLSRESLASIKSTQGVGPMIRRVGDVIEEAIDFFRDLLDGTYDIQNIKVTENLEDFADTMDRVSANPNTKYRDINDHGALHYLLSLSNITSKSIVNANDPQADTITTSKAGVAYEDNEYCVTRECFAATQASLEDEPAEGVSLTGPQIAGLLWLPIAILLLVGFCAVSSPLCCKDYKLRNVAPTCMICWMVALIPWYLIGTAFVMPLIIGGSDGCTTGTNIAVNYMVADGSSICKDFGGKGTVSACRFTGNDIDVTVDLLGMVQGVFGDCPSADPFAVPLKTLSEQFRSIPRERVERELRKDENLRQRMKDIAINAADDLSIVAREFIDTNADEVISCARIATVWQELKAPACDATAGASAWLIGMLYLAGWTMCCCGLPSTCYMQGHNEWSDFEKLDEPEDRSSQYTAEAPPDREAILLQHQDSYASDLSDQNEGRDGHASSTIRDKPSNGASAPPDNGEIPYATIAIPYGNHGDQHSRNSSGNNNATVVVIHSDEML